MKTIVFADYTWEIKNARERRVGPGPSYFSDDEKSVFVDGQGLHLKTMQEGDRYFSSEVVLDHALGFGTYQFSVHGRVSDIEAATVFGAFLYEDDDHEIDIEFGPALAGRGRGQYVIQPWEKKGHVTRFAVQECTESTHHMVWKKDSVEFVSWSGSAAEPTDETLIGIWTYVGESIASPDTARMIFNVWLHKGSIPLRTQEIVIRDFSYTP